MIEESRKDLKLCIAVRVSEDLGDVVAGMVRKSFLEGKLSRCSESSAVNSIFKDVTSSEKYWKLQNSILIQKDAVINKNPCGSSYITLSKKQIEDLTESLFHPVLQNRLKAMEYLIRCVSTDSSHIISYWSRLGLGLEENLTSSLSIISEASLQVYKKLLFSSTPEVILQVYSSLLKVLSQTLHSDFCILSLPNIYLISDIVQLVNRFQRNIMKFWFRFPVSVITGIVSNTFECYEKCQWLNEYGKNGLSHYLWLVDEHGLWLNSFLHSLVSRQAVYKAVAKQYRLLWKLVETCHSYLEEVVFGPSTSSVIQSASILLRLLEQKNGRNCLLQLFSETSFETTDDLQAYSTFESVWTLLTSVCFSLFKSSEASSVVILLCNLMQNQIETCSEVDKQILFLVLNKIQEQSNGPYLCFVSECLSKLSNSLTTRRFILRKTHFKEITDALTKHVNLDCEVGQLSAADEQKINYLNFLSNMFLEPLALLAFADLDFHEMLYNIANWLQNLYPEEVLNLLISMAESELGLYILSQNEEFTNSFFQNFSVETLLGKKNLIQFCLQILKLQVTSLDESEIVQFLMKKLKDKSLANVCRDIDNQLWTSHLNQHLRIISYYSQAFLQSIQDSHREHSHDIFKFLPVPCSNCQNCSELFALSVLNFSMYDLNVFLYLSLKVNIQEFLLEQQPKDKSVVDDCSVLRNYIITQTSVFGGSKERCLPTKTYSECEKVHFIQDLTSISLHILQCNKFQPVFSETCEELNLNEIHSKFNELISTRTFSVYDCLNFINLLVVNINEVPFEDCNADDIPSELEKCGIALALKYGRSQTWLLNDNMEKDKTNLFKLLKKIPAHTKCCFNFLGASVFLICGGNLQTSIKFLGILDSSTNTELSVVGLMNCIQDLNCNKYRGILCTIFDLIVQEEMPSVYNVFSMVNLPPHKCLTLWIGQCFWNVLNMSEIASFLLLCVLHNGYFFLYACVALLSSLETDLYEQFELQNVHLFLREYTPDEFHLDDYLNFMQDLDKKYCDLITTKLFN